jgi:adenine specific DNA methylase Mod
MNNLYFGDNLHVLRESIKDETIDLVYLDPPFNSNANYNLLFKSPKGQSSNAQIEAFGDTWHWGEQAEREFNEILQFGNTEVAEVIQALRKFLGENDMMAYLTMMANRLLELHRVLKSTGSLYLHCDPTASHYLKIVLDGVFGKGNFINEIIWKRTTTKNDYSQGAKNWPRIHDVIFYFAKDEKNLATFNQQFSAYSEEYTDSKYANVDANGRRYMLDNLTAPGAGSRGHPQFEFMGVTRYWRYNKDKMLKLAEEGRIVQPREGAVPRYVRYLDEMPGIAIGDDWHDISAINSQAQERLGYPTQKPLALLERIISASSNEGDIILDPFCGCGTAVHAAEKLKRQWIGIDITHLAITLIEKRLNDAFPAVKFEVHGTPKDTEGARNLALRDKYQFQWWACSLVNAQPWQGKKKGADSGIDGVIYFQDDEKNIGKIIVSVKGGDNVSVPMVRDLLHVVEREKAQMGIFITLADPTKPMMTEATKAGFYESPLIKKSFPKLQILTVQGLLEGKQQALYPDLGRGGLTFKKAQAENTTDQKKLF